MSEVLSFKNLTLVRDGKNILEDVSWSVSADQRWVIVGPNGAGKTSLLKLAAAQLQPSSGSAQILGETLGEINVFELRTRIGFASSAVAGRIPNSEPVLDAVMTASYAITGRFKEKYDEVDIRRAKRVLKEWDLGHLADRAFGSLDIGSREATIKILSGYASHPKAPAIVMVTHHLEEIPSGFTHALVLNNGKILEAGPITQTLTTEKLSAAYGLELEVALIGGRFTVRAK